MLLSGAIIFPGRAHHHEFRRLFEEPRADGSGPGASGREEAIMHRTLAAVVVLALTALVLASCSSKPSTSAGPADDPAAAPATVSTPTAPADTARAASGAATGSTTASRQASGTTSKSRPVVLADGRHPVFITRVNASSRTLTFDMIQFLTGD